MDRATVRGTVHMRGLWNKDDSNDDRYSEVV